MECHGYEPSDAIAFIRNYLEEKLRGNAKVQFQFLGPSPFHADFFVTRHNGQHGEAIAKDISFSGRGYRTLYFEFPVADHELIDSFISINQDILSLYYAVIRYRNRSMRLGAKIAEGTEQLYSRSQSRGFLSSIPRWFRNGRIIDDVYKSILDQKMNDIGRARFLTEAKETDTIDESDIIYPFIEREAKDELWMPTDHVKDILKMLEDRRQGYIRNTTTVVAGLIGGILGAGLTFLLSSHATNLKPLGPLPQLSVPSSNAPQIQSK